MRSHIQDDVLLTSFNTFGIAARAKRFVRIESVDALRALREHAAWTDGRRLIVGGGSNIVFTRDFDGLVVHLATRGHEDLGPDGDHRLVAVEAGESWDGFVRTSIRAGWSGLENLALIPGSVGASPVQNIGAYGLELAERFAWLDALDPETGRMMRLDAHACAFGYRESVFKHALRDRAIITRVVFRLPLQWQPRVTYAELVDSLARDAIDDPSAAQIADAVTTIRRAKLPDPARVGNAGSFFKNPLVDAATWAALRADQPDAVAYPQADGRFKLAAAWLIERCGWRGRGIAGAGDRAAVHERHALVIVNRGGATGAEVLALADAIRDSVRQRFGVDLEPEPLIV
ncbi:MAG: UDP-N-acetylmuramate dehydrogenase [Burkholderiaceae bacterium]